MKKIDSLIKKITKKPKISEGLRKIDIQEVVKNVLGKNLLNYIKDIHVMDEKLIIKLNSSSLRSELSYGAKKIISLLNDEIGEKTISKIIFI